MNRILNESFFGQIQILNGIREGIEHPYCTATNVSCAPEIVMISISFLGEENCNCRLKKLLSCFIQRSPPGITINASNIEYRKVRRWFFRCVVTQTFASSRKRRIGPKTAKIGILGHFGPGLAGSSGALLVGFYRYKT